MNNSLQIKNILKKKISKILSPSTTQLNSTNEESNKEGNKISKYLKDNLTIFNSSFKILILDSQTMDIISVLFKISDLREHNICAHYLISTNRSRSFNSINTSGSIIPVIYYISSFEELIEDVCKLNYSSYSITSSYQIKRRDLENLGIKISELKEANRILQIQDSFTNFITLQNDLFILNLKNSFSVNYLPEIVSGLFSFFTTIDQRPVIITEQNSLNTRGDNKNEDNNREDNNYDINGDNIRGDINGDQNYSNYNSGSNLNNLNYNLGNNLYLKIKNMKFIKRNNLKKPILLIIDRNLDLITPCLHVMGYLEMINDIFNFTLNKIKEFNNIDIDTELDFFIKNRFIDFPTVVSLVEEEVVNYKKDLAMHGSKARDIKNVNNNNNQEDELDSINGDQCSSINGDVGKMLDSAPELQKKSEIVSSYLNLCTKALEIIKERKLDDFYTMEQNFKKEELSNLISTNSNSNVDTDTDNTPKGNDKDVIRLCLSMIDTKNEDLIKPILETRNIKTNILDFVKNRMFPDYSSENTKKKDLINGSSGVSRETLSNFKNNSTLFKGIKDFLFKKEIPVINYIEDVISKIKNGSLDSNYNVMDTSSNINESRRNININNRNIDNFNSNINDFNSNINNIDNSLYWSEVSSVIVFFTGGGASYTEFKKIKHLENKYNIPFIVGGTEMINAENFLKELEKASI